MILFVSNCLNNVFNYIWFLNIIVFIMRFFQDSHVLFPLKKRALVIFCSMSPLVASGEKPKAPPPTGIMHIKFEYNSNIDHILVQNSNFSFSANLTALMSTNVQFHTPHRHLNSAHFSRITLD